MLIYYISLISLESRSTVYRVPWPIILGDWQDSLKLFYLVNKVLQLCTVLVTNILLITKTDSLVFQMEIPFPFTLTVLFLYIICFKCPSMRFRYFTDIFKFPFTNSLTILIKLTEALCWIIVKYTVYWNLVSLKTNKNRLMRKEKKLAEKSICNKSICKFLPEHVLENHWIPLEEGPFHHGPTVLSKLLGSVCVSSHSHYRSPEATSKDKCPQIKHIMQC